MPLSGKYDFPGIKKTGAVALKAALASTAWGAWIVKAGKPGDVLVEFVLNWLTNKGLIVLNVGAIYVNGELDQSALDHAIDSGLRRVEQGNLTPEEGKEIDDAVIAAANRALPYDNRK